MRTFPVSLAILCQHNSGSDSVLVLIFSTAPIKKISWFWWSYLVYCQVFRNICHFEGHMTWWHFKCHTHDLQLSLLGYLSSYKSQFLETDKVAQPIKALAVKPDSISLIPRPTLWEDINSKIYIAERDYWLFKVSCDL